MLFSAAALPLLILGYLALLRSAKPTVRVSDLALIRQALQSGSAWRRRVPPSLLFFAACLMVIAAARPTAMMNLPSEGKTIMLVMDVSGSMGATDVAPDRLTASQLAAREFVSQLPASVRIGVVAYGGSAHLVQAPTASRPEVIAAIERFQLQAGTAIGSGLVVALATLFPDAGYDLSVMMGGKRRGRLTPPESDQPLRQPGTHDTVSIVLLTDGQNTTGANPVDAARLAARHGVKVFTVGFGTPEGVNLTFNGWSMRVFLDEDTLRDIASITRAEYFPAPTSDQLLGIYKALRSRLVLTSRQMEVTVMFSMAASLLVLVSVALSVRWFGRVA